jgi:hypothetical protein
MAEDSGAFKTNLRIRAGFRHNLMIPGRVAGMPHCRKSIACRCGGRENRGFLPIAPGALWLFSNQSDSRPLAARSRANPVATAFPDGSMSFASTAKAEKPFMLPGFRFLFAAILLSMSMLIFGLGAAALLRAAHEEFASIPSRRAPPETIFAQRSDTGPALAMLRVEPSVVDEKVMEPPIADHVQDQPAINLAPTEVEKPATEPDKVAALTDTATPPENSPPSEAPTSEAATPEIPIQTETPSAQADDTPSPAAEMTPAAPDQSATAKPDHASAPIDDGTRIAETRIATLGGPPVTIETQMSSKIVPAVVKKSSQARRVVKRRRIAQRARVTQQAPQAPADPVARPLGR